MSPLELLDWDSRFFGIPIARVSAAAPDKVRQLASEGDARGIRCLYLLSPADEPSLCTAAEDAGFRLVDVRVELGKPLDTAVSGAAVRDASPADVPRLERLARERFGSTRFHADRMFPRDRAADLYVAWLRRGLEPGSGRRVLVLQDGGGFVSCHLDERKGRIELLAVERSLEGGGQGSALVQGAEALFMSAGAARARVVTQARNVAAQRLYQHHGYQTEAVGLWLHRWAPAT